MNREILSELKNIRILSAEIINFIKKEKKNVDKHILFDIKLCVEEALRNAIVHGNKSNKNLPVNIFYDIEGDNLKVIVRDKGNGFNVRNLRIGRQLHTDPIRLSQGCVRRFYLHRDPR